MTVGALYSSSFSSLLGCKLRALLFGREALASILRQFFAFFFFFLSFFTVRYLFCTWFVFEESSFRSDAGGPWLSYCAAPDVPDLVNLKRSGER